MIVRPRPLKDNEILNPACTCSMYAHPHHHVAPIDIYAPWSGGTQDLSPAPRKPRKPLPTRGTTK